MSLHDLIGHDELRRSLIRAYRADVTAQNWVVPGANSFTITGVDFFFASGDLDENNGVGMIVIVIATGMITLGQRIGEKDTPTTEPAAVQNIESTNPQTTDGAKP